MKSWLGSCFPKTYFPKTLPACGFNCRGAWRWCVVGAHVAAAEILGDVGGAFVLGGSWCDGTFLGQSLGLRGPGLGLWPLTV